MESKEAMRIIDKYGIELPIGKAGEIMCLIRELQNYKDIFEEIEDSLKPGAIIEVPEGFREKPWVEIIRYKIKEIKEKYFPEPEPKDTTERLNEIEKVIKNFLQDISRISVEKEVKERNKKGGISC